MERAAVELTIPIAICDAIEHGRLQTEATLLCTALGAGLSSAAATIQWSHRMTAPGMSQRELPARGRAASYNRTPTFTDPSQSYCVAYDKLVQAAGRTNRLKRHSSLYCDHKGADGVPFAPTACRSTSRLRWIEQLFHMQ